MGLIPMQNSDISIVSITLAFFISLTVVTVLVTRPQSNIVIDLGDGKPSLKITDVEKVEKVPLKR
jgi:hypothetical protein